MGAVASQITSLTIVYSTVYSDADQRKHQSFASLAFVRGIHGGLKNSPQKWPVTRKMFPFDDVIMHLYIRCMTRHTVQYHWYDTWMIIGSLQRRHNERDGVSNHRPHDCLLNRLFRRRSKKTSKLRVTNSPMTGELPAQMASNVETVSIW